MKLTNMEQDLIKLILRSPAVDTHGWRKVSPGLWPHLSCGQLPEELIRLKTVEGVNYIRLSDEGLVVAKWLV